jgi:hypothetical protein
MRNKLWYELAQSRHGFEYLALFLDVQKRRRKWFKISIIVFSTGGIMGWKLWEYAPQVACAVIAVVELFQLIENQIILKDDKFEKFSDLRTKYLEYSNHLEKLWLEYDNESKTENEVRDIYFQLRNNEFVEIQKIDNSLDIPQLRKLIKKASGLTEKYLTNHFINQ